jgi:hypothetical protein
VEPSEKYQASLLQDPDTFGSVLLTVALLKYKEQAFKVDPMALILDLEDDFRVKISERNENKLKAMLLATETQVFQQDPEAFRGICCSLWCGDPQLEYAEPLTLAEILWGIFEVRTCHGEVRLGPSIQAIFDQAAGEEVGDPESQTDAYSHAREAVQARYDAWSDQMLGLGADPKDLPSLDG